MPFPSWLTTHFARKVLLDSDREWRSIVQMRMYLCTWVCLMAWLLLPTTAHIGLPTTALGCAAVKGAVRAAGA